MPAHRLVPRIILTIGVALLGVAAYLAWREWQFAQRAERADGKIVGVEPGQELGSSDYPLIRFATRDGHSVEFRANVTMRGAIQGPGFRGYQVGQHLPVLYDPAHPADAVVDEFLLRHVASIAVAAMGGLPAGIGGTLLWLARRNRRRLEGLRLTGRRVLARITAITVDRSTSVNGRHPWCIEAECRDPESGAARQFRSVHIWSDPAPFVDRVVAVFVDARDPRRYAVDLDFLPAHAT